MKKLFIAFCTVLLLVGCVKQQEPVAYQVLPEPADIQYGNGMLKLGHLLSIGYSADLERQATLLGEWLSSDFGIKATSQEGAKGKIVLVIDPTVLPDKPEGYMLVVTKKGVEIKANASAGITYGIQTLRQILRKEGDSYIVQRGTITDYPAFGWRSFMLDDARYFKGKEVVKQLMDDMVRLKMNRFHWHLTNDQGWRIEIKKYPKLTEVGAFRKTSEINHFHSDVYDGKPHGGFYTQDDIREIVAYAADRNITIVPEVSMPGHASAAIASYPWLGTSGKQIEVPGQFGVMYDVFNVADPRVLQFFSDVMDEVIQLFPGEVMHIGGDEVRYDEWKQSKMILNYMKEHNLKTPAELQVFFTNNISKMLQAKNRRMMGWNEITGEKLHEYQSSTDTEDVSQQLAPGTIVHFWKGDPALIKKTAAKGYDIVNSYHVYTYIDYDYKSIPLEKAYSFNPVPDDLTPEEQKHILGLGCQMWGEFIPTVESMNLKVYPRIAAYAETGWTAPEKKDFARFSTALKPWIEDWKAKGIQVGGQE